MSDEQKGNGTKRAIVKPIAIMATIGVLVAALTALNTFTGLNFRPAWGYEIEQVTTTSYATQIELATIHAVVQTQLVTIIEAQEEINRTVLELREIQYVLQIEMIDREKWELRKELADHMARIKSYRNNAASIPPWLQKLVDDTDMKIKRLNSTRNKIERKLEEHTSQLEEPNT